jgi:hypothetical protein
MAVRLLELDDILQLLLPYSDQALQIEGHEDPDILSTVQGNFKVWRSQLDRLKVFPSKFKDGEADKLTSHDISVLRSQFIAVRELCGICSLRNKLPYDYFT